MKQIKKITAILMVFAMMFALVSCGKENENTDPGTEPVWVWDGPKYDEILANMGKAEVNLEGADGVLAEILSKGVLTIATSPDYPPQEGIDELTGDPMGCEILLAHYIANSLGVELKIETMDFSAVLTAVDTGKVDLGISGFGWKADREEAYELSAGYTAGSAVDHHTIVVRAEDLAKYSTLADLNVEGLVIDAQANSLQEMYVTDQLPNATLQKVSAIPDAILELITGKIDAIALDSTTAKNYCDQSNGQLVSLFIEKGIEFDLNMYGDNTGNVMAAKKGETSFIAVINQIIASLVDAEGNNVYNTWYYASCDLFGVLPDDLEE